MVAEIVFTWLPLSKRIGTALFSMRAIEVSNAFEVRNSTGGATNGYALRGSVLSCDIEPYCCCCCCEVSGTNWILPAMENPVVLAHRKGMKVFHRVIVQWLQFLAGYPLCYWYEREDFVVVYHLAVVSCSLLRGGNGR